MSNEAMIQFTGNIGSEPELRFTQSGAGVATFSVAVQARRKNGDQWEDGATTWFRCNAWRELAENIVESLPKGTRVNVTGRFEMRPWQDKEGNERLSPEVQVDSIGPDLRWATVAVNRVQRQQGGGGQGYYDNQGGGQWEGQPRGGQQGRQQGGQYGGRKQGGQQAPADDPWGSAPPQNWNQGVQQSFVDEPPF